MILPTIHTAILTDDESAIYARMGKRFQRRRRIEQALYRMATWTPAVAVLMVVLLDAR